MSELTKSHGFAFAPRHLGLALPFVVLMGTAAEAKRVALVVGNSDYAAFEGRPKASGDAKAVADALRRLDFDVTVLENATNDEFLSTLSALSKAATADEVDGAVLYFSGHGYQLDGRNYLLPVGVAAADADTMASQSWLLDDVTAQLSGDMRQTLVIVDAPGAVVLPGSTGLAPAAPGSGTFLAFAAQPGQLSTPVDGEHSPFTTALLANIERPGISASDMMNLVRLDVQDATEGLQKPWDQSALTAQFYFKPARETDVGLTDADMELLASADPELRETYLNFIAQNKIGLEMARLEETEQQLAALEFVALREEPVSADAQQYTGPISFDFVPLVDEDQTDEPVRVASAPEPRVPTVSVPPEAQGTIGAIRPREVAANTPRDVTNIPKDRASVAIAAPATPTELPTDRLAVAPGENLDVASGAADVASTASPDTAATAVASADAISGGADAERTAPAAGSGPVAGDTEAMVLAAVDPSRAVSPQTEPARIIGQEILPDGSIAEPALPAEPELEIPDDLPRAVQAELARLGCYRSGVDGIWGRGSATALLRFYLAKGLSPDQSGPTADLYRALKKEENVVCELTSTTKRIATKRPPAVTQASTKSTKKRIITAPSASGNKKSITRLDVGTFR